MPSGNVESEIVVKEIDFSKNTNLVKIAHKENFLLLDQKIKINSVPCGCPKIEFSVDQSHISAYFGRIVCV